MSAKAGEATFEDGRLNLGEIIEGKEECSEGG
jgi:hypothetical protein